MSSIVLNVHGGVVQDVFCSDARSKIYLVDWDTEESDPDAPGLVEVDTAGHGIQRPYVAEIPASSLAHLVGTDVERALRAANLHP